MFRKIRSALLRGLVVVLPIGFTIWLLWWLSSSTEALLRRLILLVVPPEHYLPGMGIAAGARAAAGRRDPVQRHAGPGRARELGSGSWTAFRSSRRSTARPATS